MGGWLVTKIRRRVPASTPDPTGRQPAPGFRDTRDAVTNHDGSSYRFFRARLHYSTTHKPRWYVVDRIDNTIAWGTDINGYADFEPASLAYRRCMDEQGKWLP